jgi:hypothetical protein
MDELLSLYTGNRPLKPDLAQLPPRSQVDPRIARGDDKEKLRGRSEAKVQGRLCLAKV